MTTPTDDGPKLSLQLFADFRADLSNKLEQVARSLQHLQTRADISPHKYTLRAGGVVAANGTLLLPLGKPSLGREWVLRHWSVTDPNNLNFSTTGTPAVAGTPTIGEGAFAAGAAGTATLPAGSSMSGFTVTTGAPGTPPVATTVTVSGLQGTNPVYDLIETANGATLNVQFVPPIPPFSAGSTPTVTVAAAAGGAAGHIDVYGITAGTAAVPAAGLIAGTAGIYTGSPDAFNSGNAEDWSNVLPFFERVTSESVWTIPQDWLFIYVTGATPGQNILAKARILDYPQWTAAPVQGA